jgi:ribosomal protein L37E
MKLVDANAVICILSDHTSPENIDTISQIAHKIIALPDQQKYGEWTEVFNTEDKSSSQPTFQCSFCNQNSIHGKTAYCPHCGAKMSNPE